MATLHPQTEGLLAFIKSLNRPELCDMTVANARAVYRDGRFYTQPDPPEVGQISSHSVPGPLGPIPVRGYRPMGSDDNAVLPVLVYFHGGGWTIGDLDTHDVLCRQLCNQSGCAVFSIDYRMGPEDKFPAAVNDCMAATEWIVAQAASLRVDPARLAVGGDSAGGNLAAVISLLARDKPGPAIRYQLLIYPATEAAGTLPSHARNGVGYLLTSRVMKWFMGNYVRTPEDMNDWRASPLFAPSLKGLPPAMVLTAGFDPLVDEGKAYADRLLAEGVTTEYLCYEQQVHGFITMGKVLDEANEAVSRCAKALASALA